MADFTKFKVGSTSYNVKDANAARSLDQPLKGTLALKNAANQQIADTMLKLDSSLADVTIDFNSLADGDVVTYDANTQEWVNKPAGGGGGGANTNIAFIAQASGWPTLNTIYGLPGVYKLTNQIGIKATSYGQHGQTETGILASAILIDDTYASVEDYWATIPAQGASLKITAWFIVDANRIAKVTADCTYDGNGGYTVSSASATSVSYVGE